jgi:hypothetical protein
VGAAAAAGLPASQAALWHNAYAGHSQLQHPLLLLLMMLKMPADT